MSSSSSVRLSARERRVPRASLTVRPTLDGLERLEKLCLTLNYTKQAVFDAALGHVLRQNGKGVQSSSATLPPRSWLSLSTIDGSIGSRGGGTSQSKSASARGGGH